MQEACRNAALLYREIKAQGYQGGSATVRRLKHLRRRPIFSLNLSVAELSPSDKHQSLSWQKQTSGQPVRLILLLFIV